MLRQAISFLKNPPAHRAVPLFLQKYSSLFVTDTKLLSQVLKWKWSEKNYNSLCFFVEIINHKGRQEEHIEQCPITEIFYFIFRDYILDWFYYDFNNLPFKSWDHLGKEGWELCQVLFSEKELKNRMKGKQYINFYSKDYHDSLDRFYKKNEHYKKVYKKCEIELKGILRDDKVLYLLLNSKQIQVQYEGLMYLSYLIKRSYFSGTPPYFVDILPVYKDVYKYMNDWGQFYYKAIAFKEWEDLAREGICSLKTWVKEKKLNKFKKESRYKVFFKKFQPRYNMLLLRDYKQVNEILKSGVKREEVKEFIDILDQKGIVASEFFQYNGRDIFTNAKLLLALLEEKWSKQKRLKLVRLGWIIDMKIRKKYSGNRSDGKQNFDSILPIYRYFADYMNWGCSFFGNRRIPFEEWEDLAKEQVDNLKILVEKNQLKNYRRTKIELAFGEKYRKRLAFFEKVGYLNELDFMDAPSGL